MSTWFKDTNIYLAELASVYRTPEQGVSAKSNSNIAFNDYRRMTPQANGANNSITTAGSQTLRFDDLADTGGVEGLQILTLLELLKEHLVLLLLVLLLQRGHLLQGLMTPVQRKGILD